MENTDEDMDIGMPVTATDNDTGQTLTYTLGGTDKDSFAINAATSDGDMAGQIKTKAKLDYEKKKTYMVTVTATDSSGETNDSASIPVTIYVTNVDEGPMIFEGGLAISGRSRIDYAENDRDVVETYTVSGPNAASATWSLEGDDAGDFRISSGGMLTFNSSPNYEMRMDANTDNTYMVTLKANDGTYTDTHDVTVMVTNMEEDGSVTLSSMTPVVGVELTASLKDDDGIVTEAWQWSKSMDMSSWMDITDATSMNYTPVGGDEDDYYLRATVTYTDNHGPAVKTERAMTTNKVVADADALLFTRYDTNPANGMIDKAEVIAAINEYLDAGADAPSKADVIRLINLYLDG